MDEIKTGLDKLWSLARIDNPEIKMLGGVSAGIAYSFSIAPWIVRLLFALSAIFSFGTTLVIYAVLWLVLPKITVDRNTFERRVAPQLLGPVIAESSPLEKEFKSSTPEDVIITPYEASSSAVIPVSEPERSVEVIDDAVIKPLSSKNA